ncbi:MAG: CPXCG motif-containing cysteine-rich protein [Cytophagales bacterium]|nr:CPXCG motif-containing cysteine-rich protein [Cytophagales bacterium]
MEEYFYKCPCCWQQVSILVDKSVEKQSFVEDCELCCRPLQFDIEVKSGKISAFEAKSLDE